MCKVAIYTLFFEKSIIGHEKSAIEQQKIKNHKPFIRFVIHIKECRQWDLNPHVVAHNRF